MTKRQQISSDDGCYSNGVAEAEIAALLMKDSLYGQMRVWLYFL